MRIRTKLLLAAVAILAMACESEDSAPQGQVMSLSISSNGDYIVSAHLTKNLRIWDVAAHRQRRVADDANIYSAYFVRRRNAYLWQDLKNIVRVQTVGGKVLKKFEHFATYGHVVSTALETYVAANKDWDIHLGYGQSEEVIKNDSKGASAIGIGKILNLELGGEASLLLSSGRGLVGNDRKPISKSPPVEPESVGSDYEGVVLWELPSGRPLRKLAGNVSKTHATLSPGGKHVVAVDENGQAFHWNLKEETKQKLSSLRFGIDDEGLGFDKSGMHLDYPEDFPDDFERAARIGVHFVSDRHYVVLYYQESYAAIYELGDPYAIGIADLGENPFPSVARYSRSGAVDSAPDANLLVTGQRSEGGINVYRFDPEELTLTKVWAPSP